MGQFKWASLYCSPSELPEMEPPWARESAKMPIVTWA